jgi:prepilin-type N-terminal cleavage/methylation domain-containing protein
MLSILKQDKGFTLVELVIIIVILGILAAVAIPKYQDMSTEAREAAARGSLGNVRSAITIYYANTAVQTGVATWPTQVQLETSNTVMAQSMPKNPYVDDANAPDSVVTGVTKGVVVPGGRGGWAYLAASGEVWLNSNPAGENSW